MVDMVVKEVLVLVVMVVLVVAAPVLTLPQMLVMVKTSLDQLNKVILVELDLLVVVLVEVVVDLVLLDRLGPHQMEVDLVV